MTGHKLRTLAIRLYGQRGWQKQLAHALGRDVSTIRRYIESDKVPEIVALAVLTLKSSSDKDPRR